MRTLIKNGNLVLDGRRMIYGGSILIENQKIIGIYKETPNVAADEIIDAHGEYVLPGFLDMHTHGSIGYDFNLCTKEDIHKVAKDLLKEGITGFLTSLVAESHKRTKEILHEFEGCDCPQMIGIHMEGPYLNRNKKAVMKEEFLRDPDMVELQEYLQISSKLCSMTIAPELPQALDMITFLHNHGIIANVGHSDGTCEQVLTAQQYGASGVTHLYNAMTQHEHRKPGVVTGAILSNLYCELIADGFHVHPDIVRATYQAIGKERIVLITDANPCKGLGDGAYEFSGKHVIMDHGHATVKETGRIAGSTLTMIDAGKHMMEYCGCSISDIVQMAAVNPAEQYHLHRGKIEIGYHADILIVNNTLDLLHVFSNDSLVY